MEGVPVLVVEDDPTMGANLQRALSASGFRVARANTVSQAREITEQPALVLLDLGLPDGDGLDLSRELNLRWPGVRIIMLTARADEMEVVLGLDSGATDYVTKPFRLAELLARVRAHTRDWELTDQPSIIDGDLVVNTVSRRVTLAGEELRLRAKEFDLLVELVGNKDVALTREHLMDRVWDEHWFGSTKTLDVHIAALRRRLGEEPGETSRITALRGVGYRWESDETRQNPDSNAR